MIAVLAHALKDQCDVEWVHHVDGLDREKLEKLTGFDLGDVRFRYVAPLGRSRVSSSNPLVKWREAKSRYAELSRPYDLFVTLVHGEEPPPYCHAAVGVLVVLFPLSLRPRLWPSLNGSSWLARGKVRFGRRYLDWEWTKRIESYSVRLAISEYVRRWTENLWGGTWQVLFPPVDTEFDAPSKEKTIVSVGRFSRLKKTVELVRAFRECADLHPSGWRLVCMGGVGASAEETEVYEEMRRLSEGMPIEIMPNLSRAQVKEQLARASVFWHAAGYGEDEAAAPGQSEHFGIATVEAMAAGCLPIVIDKGAQPELVEHGATGFLWKTLDDLRRFTRAACDDEAARRRMSEAARSRAKRFSHAEFIRGFGSCVEPYLPQARKALLI
jgi:glycosyltransferase involved in cell wall biosynthesis